MAYNLGGGLVGCLSRIGDMAGRMGGMDLNRRHGDLENWRKTLLRKLGYLKLCHSCELLIHQIHCVRMLHVSFTVQQRICRLLLHQKNSENIVSF